LRVDTIANPTKTPLVSYASYSKSHCMSS